LPFYRNDLSDSGLARTPDQIEADTDQYLPDTLKLADKVFGAWLNQLDTPSQRIVPSSR